MVSPLKLDHSQKDISKAFGLTDYEEHYVKAAIVFETIANHVKVTDLYDSPDEAPREMTSITGVLSAVLRHAQTEAMRDFMLLNFRVGYLTTREALEQVAEIEKDGGKMKEGEDPIKQIMMKLVNTLKVEGLKQTIRKIKECNYEFSRFIKVVMPEEGHEQFKSDAKSIDDLLNGILGKQDDDED